MVCASAAAAVHVVYLQHPPAVVSLLSFRWYLSCTGRCWLCRPCSCLSGSSPVWFCLRGLHGWCHCCHERNQRLWALSVSVEGDRCTDGKEGLTSLYALQGSATPERVLHCQVLALLQAVLIGRGPLCALRAPATCPHVVRRDPQPPAGPCVCLYTVQL